MKTSQQVLLLILLIACVSAKWVWSDEEAAVQQVSDHVESTPIETQVEMAPEDYQVEGASVSILSATPEFLSSIKDAFTLASNAAGPTTTTIPVDKLKGIVEHYSPIVYIPKKETSNPVAIEWVTDWSGVTDAQLNDKDYKLSYSLKNSPFKNNAPVYATVKTVGSEVWISYTILQAYNGCGPEMSVTASVCGEGIKDKRVSLCPGGVHNGDFEHITVAVENLPAGNNNMPKVLRVYVAYHSFGDWHSTNQLQWEGSHPVIYMAVGSHASYIKPGAQFYNKLWEEKSSIKCPAMCKKYGIPYPCLKSGNAITNGYFVDFTSQTSDSNKWTPTAKLLAIDATPISGISTTELKLLKFQGRFGLKIVNNQWNTIKDTILDLTYPVRKISSAADKKIKSGLNSADAEMQSEAPEAIGKKGYYSMNSDA